MTVAAVELTGPQINRLHNAVKNPPWVPNFAETGLVNPRLKVFTAYFDGTENNVKDNKRKKTMIGSLWEASQEAKDTRYAARYYKGVGSEGTPVLSKLKAITGDGCRDNAEAAYADLCRQAEEWRKLDPLCEIHVHMAGFSRGAATALHFSNILDRQGIAAVPGGPFANKTQLRSFIPGMVKSSAVLLDTVATGQETLDLSPPVSLVAILHLVAGGEERSAFPLTSIGGALSSSEWALVSGVKAPRSNTQFSKDGSFLYHRTQQIQIEGARHSDIGDAYGNGIIGSASKYLVAEFQQSLGIPVPGVERPSFQSIQKAFAHDSRWLSDKVMGVVATVLGQTNSRTKVVRELKEQANISWKGDFIQTATLSIMTAEGAQVGESHKTRIFYELKEGSLKPTDEALRRSYLRKFKGKDLDIGGVLPCKAETLAENFKIAVDETGQKRLYYGNDIIDDNFKGEDSIFQQALKMGPESDLRFRVGISNKKQIVPKIDFKQNIAPFTCMNRDKSNARSQQDAFPKRLRDLIMHLNESKPASMQEAKELMNDAMVAANNVIKNYFANVDSVEFSKGRKDALVRIKCTGEQSGDTPWLDLPNSKSSVFQPAHPDKTLNGLVKDLESAINIVAKQLSAYGMNTHQMLPKPVQPQLTAVEKTPQPMDSVDLTRPIEYIATVDTQKDMESLIAQMYSMENSEYQTRMRMQ